ncbi:tyrosine-type recombinase/integrase [Foetidibacter luteolus]|uniref:tyrosine-type recombinase/integrase n=1 Tax=Foetidibacter luteolus TaxID=2608880 RepID=UPI00129A52A5|nr:tyrosine-type recombinase/integrase [Foetidibacter luteolus]
MHLQINQFATYLSHVGYQSQTQKTIISHVKEFLSREKCEAWSDCSMKQILNFLSYLRNRPLIRKPGVLSSSMTGQYIFALKVFLRWGELCGKLVINPFDHIKLPVRARSTSHKPLSRNDIIKLFDACADYRERALLHLFYSCGLRRGEVLRLKLTDVSLKEHTVYIRNGKGKKRRLVPFTEEVGLDLAKYIGESSISRKKGSEAFMLTYSRKKMSSTTCYRIFKGIIHRSGMTARSIGFHDLRFSVATHLLEAGMPMHIVRDFLGHSCLASTHIYAKPHPSKVLEL